MTYPIELWAVTADGGLEWPMLFTSKELAEAMLGTLEDRPAYLTVEPFTLHDNLGTARKQYEEIMTRFKQGG